MDTYFLENKNIIHRIEMYIDWKKFLEDVNICNIEFIKEFKDVIFDYILSEEANYHN